MNPIAIKICGVRLPECAQFSVNEGADFIGMVFHPESRRHVDIKQATKISEAVAFNGGIPVAVVVDQDAAAIKKICQKTGISHVQFHGRNAIESIPSFGEEIVKILAIKVSDQGISEEVPEEIFSCLDPERDYLLYDGKNPGSGSSFSLDLFQPIREFRFFIAGGLTPENIPEVINILKPFGVDVSSGVETEAGVKDPAKIKHFINQARSIRG